MKQQRPKRIVVTGDGPYAGFFIAKGFKGVKGASWYDYTKQAREAIEREKRLVEDGIVKKDALKPKGSTSSGADPRNCDVLVTVSKDQVKAEQKPKGRKKTFRLKPVKKMSDLDAMGREFVKTVQALVDK